LPKSANALRRSSAERRRWLKALRDPAPATAEEAISAVAVVSDQHAPDMDERTFDFLCDAIADRGYTRTELAWIVSEMRYDETLTERRDFDHTIRPSDFDRLAERFQRLQRILTEPVLRRDLRYILRDFPRYRESDWAICSYTEDDHPIMMYPKDPPTKRPTPRPRLEEKTTPRRSGKDAGLRRLSAAVPDEYKSDA